jgi:hypothetical protein
MGQKYFPDRIKVNEKALLLIRLYYMFLNHFKLDASIYILQHAVLKDVVVRYWRDVDRLHRYHDISRINRHKIAGYLTHWICKLRPIVVAKNDEFLSDPDMALYINEIFAVFVAVARIQEYHNKNGGKKIKVKKETFDTCLYNLRYRPVTGDMLSMVYGFIEETSLVER